MEVENVNVKNWKSLIKPSKLDVQISDDLTHAKIIADKERCRGHADWTFSVDPFTRFGPWVLAEARWRYPSFLYPNHSA